MNMYAAIRTRNTSKKNLDKLNSTSIEKVSPKDWARIKDQMMPLEHKIFDKDRAFDELNDFKQTFTNPRAINLVVYNGDAKTIIGYLIAQPLVDTECHTGVHNRKGIMYLESVGILPKYQGQGIGYRLMNALLLFTSLQKKYRGVLLDSTSDGMYKLAKKFKFKTLRYNYGHCYGGAKMMWRGKKW